jgi:hypothetical protein
MNADTSSLHLDLGDLIAEAAGQPVGDRARQHLAGCESCRLEANRWNLVAEGVRGLADAEPQAAQPARPRHAVWRVLAGPRRRTVLAGAAAALVLIGAGFGVGAAVSGHAPGTTGNGPVTALTAVTGCAQLEQASGTLEQVNGSSLVIKTASGRPVTVTTTATTRMNASGALVEDITDGADVLVAGPSSGGTIAADFVVVGSGASLAALPGVAEVQGTVSDASSAGFTVVTSAGTRVPVTTSSHTDVTLFHARPGQLQAGGSTIAIGYARPGGTLSAIGIFQPPSWPVRDCSPASINRAIMVLASGG